jgi:hypothetical protein
VVTSVLASLRRCMVSHFSDMQDLSQHTILRHLQDTEVPLYPCHYSYSSNYCTGLIIPTPYQYRCYQCHIYPSLSRGTIPRRLQDTAVPSHPRYDSPIPRFTMPGSSLSIPTALLPHIRTHTATPDPLPHNTRLEDMTPTLFPFSPDTSRPILVILADGSICIARCQHLRFRMATTSRSGPSESTLTQH